jgi:hypothetical protein
LIDNAKRKYPGELAENIDSCFDWMVVRKTNRFTQEEVESYVLPITIADVSSYVEIHCNILGQYHSKLVTRKGNNRKPKVFVVVKQTSSMEQAVKMTEKYIEKIYPQKFVWITRDGKWKSGPASEKQLTYLKSLVGETFASLSPETMTKGEAAAKITEALQRQSKVLRVSYRGRLYSAVFR